MYLDTGGSQYAHIRKSADATSAISVDLNAEWLPLEEVRGSNWKEETPASRFSFSFTATARSTRTAAEIRSEDAVGAVARLSESEVAPGTTQIERDAAVRLEILARKSAGSISTEEEARFRVATERLRKLLPRVTTADFEALADLAEGVASSGQRIADLRTELGLNK